VIRTPAEREAHHQVAMRAANEAQSIGIESRASADAGDVTFRCECGDAACEATIVISRSEYEAVRAVGSRFMIVDTHENPEISLVVSTNTRFAVVETIGREARRIALRGNPRAGWAPA
jgi:hypothetical protein